MKTSLRVALVISLSVVAFAACDSDDSDSGGPGSGGSAGRPPDTGAACEVDGDCFPDVVEGELQGDALCLTRVRDGYCTHTCESDDDCCAVEGECKTDLAQVCSPFESSDMQMCFLSCEDQDVDAVDDAADEQAYCQRYASPDFICRSSGGGTQNRKICVPGDCGLGADCASDADCSGDLECFTAFHGGFCGTAGCNVNADCPDGALCVVSGDGNNYCFARCASAAECSYCRHDGAFATCSDEVTYAEEGTSGSVCVPPS